MKRILAAAIVCAPLSAQAQTTATVTAVPASPASVLVVQKPAEVVSGSALPSNSDVWLSMDQQLNTKKVKQAQFFDMKVSRDVMLGNYVIIPRGTPARGQVSYRTGKGAFGKSGKMEFDLVDIQLPGRTIPVAGHYRVEGAGNTGAAVGAVVAVGVFGAFVKGHSAVVEQGSEWKAETKEPIMISIAAASPAAMPTAPVAAPVTPPADATPAVVTKTK